MFILFTYCENNISYITRQTLQLGDSHPDWHTLAGRLQLKTTHSLVLLDNGPYTAVTTITKTLSINWACNDFTAIGNQIQQSRIKYRQFMQCSCTKLIYQCTNKMQQMSLTTDINLVFEERNMVLLGTGNMVNIWTSRPEAASSCTRFVTNHTLDWSSTFTCRVNIH